MNSSESSSALTPSPSLVKGPHPSLLLVGSFPFPQEELSQACRTSLGDCDVLFAANGAQAIRTLQRRTIDLLVCGLLLPDMHALELLRSPDTNKSSLLLLTKFANEIDSESDTLDFGRLLCLRESCSLATFLKHIVEQLNRLRTPDFGSGELKNSSLLSLFRTVHSEANSCLFLLEHENFQGRLWFVDGIVRRAFCHGFSLQLHYGVPKGIHYTSKDGIVAWLEVMKREQGQYAFHSLDDEEFLQQGWNLPQKLMDRWSDLLLEEAPASMVQLFDEEMRSKDSLPSIFQEEETSSDSDFRSLDFLFERSFMEQKSGATISSLPALQDPLDTDDMMDLLPSEFWRDKRQEDDSLESLDSLEVDGFEEGVEELEVAPDFSEASKESEENPIFTSGEFENSTKQRQPMQDEEPTSAVIRRGKNAGLGGIENAGFVLDEIDFSADDILELPSRSEKEMSKAQLLHEKFPEIQLAVEMDSFGALENHVGEGDAETLAAVNVYILQSLEEVGTLLGFGDVEQFGATDGKELLGLVRSDELFVGFRSAKKKEPVIRFLDRAQKVVVGG